MISFKFGLLGGKLSTFIGATRTHTKTHSLGGKLMVLFIYWCVLRCESLYNSGGIDKRGVLRP